MAVAVEVEGVVVEVVEVVEVEAVVVVGVVVEVVVVEVVVVVAVGVLVALKPKPNIWTLGLLGTCFASFWPRSGPSEKSSMTKGLHVWSHDPDMFLG